MARLGRSFPQKHQTLGFPPAVVAPTPAPVAPIAGGLNLTSGGRHGRATPTRPLTVQPPRPLAGGSTTYNDSGTVAFALTASGADSHTHTAARTVAYVISGTGSDTHSHTGSGTTAYVVSGSGTDSWSVADSGSVLVTLTLTGSEGSSAATQQQHGGNRTHYDGDTLAEIAHTQAHAARLLEEERQRADDEALVLLLCA